MRLATPTIASQVMKIDPDLAKEMLETSVGNRKLRNSHVENLAGAMKRGEWLKTNQGIGFDKNGNLRDGHHRLSACILANTSFDSLVVLGLPINAYEVIDTGAKRTYADRIDEHRAITDVLRLGCTLLLNTSQPTVEQMRPIINSALTDHAKELVSHCGSVRRFYSSAPVKLAACISVMAGGNKQYVFDQYRALVMLDFESMSKASQALVRQVNAGKVKAVHTRETLTRSLRAFDQERANVTRIQICEDDFAEATTFVRQTLRRSISTNSAEKS